MITLLSPAKSLEYDAPAKLENLSDHVFPKETMRLVRLLKKHKSADLQKLMHISEKLGDLNASRYKTFSKEYNIENSRAAFDAFQGDVYVGLDATTLSDADVTYAQDNIRILSGLYGILKPLDKMQAYRLEMGTKLENKQGSNLYHFWGDKISKELNKELKEKGQDTIINLASNEYFKSVNKKKLKADIIDITFKEEKDGELKFVSFFAKKARGLMARYIIKNRIEEVEHLQGFDYEGYTFHSEGSNEKELLFIR